jgi:hypothetical protein
VKYFVAFLSAIYRLDASALVLSNRMSRILFAGMFVLACVASACGSASGSTAVTPSPATPAGPFADLSGTWTGTIESANFSTRTITLTVAQTTNCVDGAWISSTGDWRGAISGFATANAFEGFLSFERSTSGGGQCNATGTVSGAASQSALRVTGTSLSPVGGCVGDLPSGIVVTLHR